MKRFLTFLGLAFAVVALAAPTEAQVNPFRVVIVPSSQAIALSTGVIAVDTAPALLIKYVGTTVQTATVAVTTDDFIFVVAGSPDATINVQATTPCGAVVGTLDTGDTDCDTVTELVNEINASGNWFAIPIGVLGTDATGTTLFKDLSVTTGVVAAGVTVFIDSAASLFTSNAFTPSNTLDIRDYMDGNRAKTNFWAGYTTALEWYLQNFVGTAGAGSIVAVSGNFAVTGSTKVYTETSRVVFSFTGSATGVDKENDFKTAPLFTNPGEHFLYRGASGTTHTSPLQRARGFAVPKTPSP